MDETRLTARLPNLEVEIIRREDAAQNAEMLTLNFRAVPSFEAFGRYLLGSASESSTPAEASPFGLWLDLWQQAWAPWLEAARAVREKADTEAPQAPTAELAGSAPAAGSAADDQEPKYAAR